MVLRFHALGRQLHNSEDVNSGIKATSFHSFGAFDLVFYKFALDWQNLIFKKGFPWSEVLVTDKVSEHMLCRLNSIFFVNILKYQSFRSLNLNCSSDFAYNKRTLTATLC